MKHTVATFTNIAYGIAGAWLINQGLLIAGIASIALMLGSGIHHYYLQESTRKYDYIAMYLVFISLALSAFSLIPIVTALSTAVGAVGLYLVWGNSRTVIGTLVGVVIVIVAWQTWSDLQALLEILTFTAIALVFNKMGDAIHKDNHDWIHGLGWHVPTAYAITLVGGVL